MVCFTKYKPWRKIFFLFLKQVFRRSCVVSYCHLFLWKNWFLLNWNNWLFLNLDCISKRWKNVFYSPEQSVFNSKIETRQIFCKSGQNFELSTTREVFTLPINICQNLSRLQRKYCVTLDSIRTLSVWFRPHEGSHLQSLWCVKWIPSKMERWSISKLDR